MAEFIVRVTPKSSRSAVVIEGDLIRVYVTAPPAGGEANKAVIDVLAKKLSVAKSRIDIVRGHTSRDKSISVQDIDLEAVLLALRA